MSTRYLSPVEAPYVSQYRPLPIREVMHQTQQLRERGDQALLMKSRLQQALLSNPVMPLDEEGYSRMVDDYQNRLRALVEQEPSYNIMRGVQALADEYTTRYAAYARGLKDYSEARDALLKQGFSGEALNRRLRLLQSAYTPIQADERGRMTGGLGTIAFADPVDLGKLAGEAISGIADELEPGAVQFDAAGNVIRVDTRRIDPQRVRQAIMTRIASSPEAMAYLEDEVRAAMLDNPDVNPADVIQGLVQNALDYGLAKTGGIEQIVHKLKEAPDPDAGGAGENPLPTFAAPVIPRNPDLLRQDLQGITQTQQQIQDIEARLRAPQNLGPGEKEHLQAQLDALRQKQGGTEALMNTLVDQYGKEHGLTREDVARALGLERRDPPPTPPATLSESQLTRIRDIAENQLAVIANDQWDGEGFFGTLMTEFSAFFSGLWNAMKLSKPEQDYFKEYGMWVVKGLRDQKASMDRLQAALSDYVAETPSFAGTMMTMPQGARGGYVREKIEDSYRAFPQNWQLLDPEGKPVDLDDYPKGGLEITHFVTEKVNGRRYFVAHVPPNSKGEGGGNYLLYQKNETPSDVEEILGRVVSSGGYLGSAQATVGQSMTNIDFLRGTENPGTRVPILFQGQPVLGEGVSVGREEDGMYVARYPDGVPVRVDEYGEPLPKGSRGGHPFRLPTRAHVNAVLRNLIENRQAARSTPTASSEVEARRGESDSPLDTLVGFAKQFGFTVTSADGDGHNKGSLHYEGRAIDVRTRDKSPREIEAFIQRARAAGFRVRDERHRPPGQRVWTGPHLHLEYRG